jgi:hypothetical protein
MNFLRNLFGNKQSDTNQPKQSTDNLPKQSNQSQPKKDLPVSGGHVEMDKPLHCPKCGDLKRETTPRYAALICNKCGAKVTINDYIVR